MIFSKEKIQAPVGGRKWRRQKDQEQEHEEENKQVHYSKKGGHRARSEANDPHKKSRRR